MNEPTPPPFWPFDSGGFVGCALLLLLPALLIAVVVRDCG